MKLLYLRSKEKSIQEQIDHYNNLQSPSEKDLKKAFSLYADLKIIKEKIEKIEKANS